MADKRISELADQTGAGLADGDFFVTVDVDVTTMAASGTDKRITRKELFAGMAGRVTFDGGTAGYTTPNATDRYIAQIGTMNSARSARLPLANAVPAGAMVTVADESGTVSSTYPLNVRVTSGSSDTIDGVADATQFVRLKAPYASATLVSDGSSKWSIVSIKPAVDIQTFAANGTWNRPLGYTWLRAILFGGGGGGGSGRRGAAGSSAYGGGGGQAGGITAFDVPLADLPNASYTVTVAASAAGGAAKTTAADGASGTDGNNTYFTSTSQWVAQGGAAGGGGDAAIGTGGGAGKGAGTVIGALGGDPDSAGFQGGSGYGTPVIAPGGGGGGAHILAAGTFDNAGAGGNSSGGVGINSAGLAGGTAGANTGAAGGAGTAPTTITTNAIAGGAGGGGGGSNTSGSAAGAGGAGAVPGGGGGGGGGSNNANSGKGGDGAAGYAVIICW